MALSIIDIANMAGVSTATVSRFFNSPEMLSEKNKKIIGDVVDKMNYQPNALARGLRKNETRSIGIIFPDIKNIFYPEIIRGIEDVFQKDGYTVRA